MVVVNCSCSCKCTNLSLDQRFSGLHATLLAEIVVLRLEKHLAPIQKALADAYLMYQLPDRNRSQGGSTPRNSSGGNIQIVLALDVVQPAQRGGRLL